MWQALPAHPQARNLFRRESYRLGFLHDFRPIPLLRLLRQTVPFGKIQATVGRQEVTSSASALSCSARTLARACEGPNAGGHTLYHEVGAFVAPEWKYPRRERCQMACLLTEHTRSAVQSLHGWYTSIAGWHDSHTRGCNMFYISRRCMNATRERRIL